MKREQRARIIVNGGTAVAVQRPLASGLTVVGVILVVLGLGRLLLALEVLPDEVGDAFARWWPLGLVVAGVWLAVTGRRVSGTLLLLVGGAWTLFAVVPDGFTGPALLIVVGAVFIVGALGGRRWVFGGDGVAVFDDVRGMRDGDPPARSYVAVFGESEGRLEATLADEGVVECLAVFGDVQVRVPADVAVELTETAVFGDVRAPEPPTGEVVATVTVRATAVFGDVKLIRDPSRASAAPSA
jgi:hypothetical protein